MSLFRSDGDGPRSDARSYSSRIDVEPQGETRRENIAEPRRYIVEYGAYEDNSRLTDQDHVHYYPDDDGNDSLAFDIRSSGTLTRR